MKVRFHGEATAELEEALDWYAVRSSDAERAFALAVDESLAISSPDLTALPK